MGKAGGVLLPLPFNQKNGCISSGLDCPLQAGRNYTVTRAVKVYRIYPKAKRGVTVDVTVSAPLGRTPGSAIGGGRAATDGLVRQQLPYPRPALFTAPEDMRGYQVLLRWLLLGAAACPSGALIGQGEDKTTAIFLTSSGSGPVVASSSKKPAPTVGRVTTTRGPRRPAGGNTGFASCKSRRGAMPDMEPLEVLSSLASPVHCLAACLLKSPRCKAFAFGNRSCDLLQRSPCDSRRPMRDAPGFAHYDVLTRDRLLLNKGDSPDCAPTTSTDYSSTVQTTAPPSVTPTEGKKPGPTFVFRRGPTTFEAAQRACSDEGLALAMPVSAQDHATLVNLMRRNRAPRLWIGVQRVGNSLPVLLSYL
ncbi:hypothetical protein V5799_033368 [Amblyomma americanum]|uniref:Apple domain-containing protein n=1 Tax=Amblyomma americanum TaxID=6943 RepID=A0AAQ4DNI2_AMBAM